VRDVGHWLRQYARLGKKKKGAVRLIILVKGREGVGEKEVAGLFDLLIFTCISERRGEERALAEAFLFAQPDEKGRIRSRF